MYRLSANLGQSHAHVKGWTKGLVWCGLLLIVLLSNGNQRIPLKHVISFGERLEGVLHQAAAIRQKIPRGPESRWIFQGRDGQQVVILGESYEFDVYLLLLDPSGRQIAWADDNAGFFNARIAMALPDKGLYTVVVCGTNADQAGTYWLSLNENEDKVDWTQAAAESYYRSGMEWARSNNNNRAVSWLNLGIGRYFRQRRQWEKTEKYYEECMSACAKSDDLLYGQWAVALERGRLFARRRLYDQAVGEFQRALEMSKSLQSSQEAETLVLVELGSLYSLTARADLMKVYFRTATTNVEQYARQTTLVGLYASLNMAAPSDDIDRAVLQAEEAYSLCEGLDPELQLKAMQALAGTYLFLAPERSKEGLALATQMRLKAQQMGYLDEEVAALNLMSMGEYAANNIEKMISLAGEALALTSPSDDNPTSRRIALQVLADGEMARGNYQAARGWCMQALQTVESAWAKRGLEEFGRELLSQARAISTQTIMILYALNAEHPNAEYARQAFDYAEHSRCRFLLDQLLRGRERSDTVVDPQPLDKDQELLDRISKVRGQLAMLHASSDASRENLYRLQEERAHLIAERIQLQAQIGNSEQNTYRAAHLSPLTAEQTQRKLAESYPNTAILYYQLGIQQSFLIALTQHSCEFFKLPNWKTISKAVQEWRLQISAQQNSLESGPSELQKHDELAHNLYNLLVKPASDLIKGRDLIIVPSDALCSLAFEALVVGDPQTSEPSTGPKYLVEQHAITYAPSISVLAGIERRRHLNQRRQRMLLLGEISVDGSRIVGSETGSRPSALTLDGLPAARKEITDIAKIAKQSGIAVTNWLGPEANEAKLKSSNLHEFSFMHIATHGISDSQDGDASAVILSPDRDGTQDGVLTSGEIAKLKLNSDLVVLSGCETSLGQRSSAEGVVGLYRTFLIAGARLVCGSLWQVEDTWTQKLMSAFYTKLLIRHFSKPQALRMAKLEMISRGAKPSQWAPFILTGSSR